MDPVRVPRSATKAVFQARLGSHRKPLIDYANTRPEIDSQRLASSDTVSGPILLRVPPRFEHRSAALVCWTTGIF